MAHILVVGKLGEVIKKVLELEAVLDAHNGNQILLAELAAYQEVLKMWPVENQDIVQATIQVFKLNLAKLKQAEDELCALTRDSVFMFMTIMEYVKYLNYVRNDMQALNELGMHIGPSPILEVADEVEQSNLISAVSGQ